MPFEIPAELASAATRSRVRRVFKRFCPGCRTQMSALNARTFVCDPCGRFWELDASGKPRSF